MNDDVDMQRNPRWRLVAERSAIAVVMVGLVMLGAAPMWMAYFEAPPLEYPAPMKVLNEPVHRGDVVVFQGEVCNRSGQTLAYTFSRRLERVDPNQRETITLPSGPATIQSLGCELRTNRAPNLIPIDINCGEWVYGGVATVSGKTGRSHQVSFISEPFTVTGCGV